MAQVSEERCALPAHFDVRNVEAVHDQLMPLWRAGSVRVDAGAVKAVDTAAVQLLVVLRRSAQAEGVALEIANPSEELRQASAVLGVDGLLWESGA